MEHMGSYKPTNITGVLVSFHGLQFRQDLLTAAPTPDVFLATWNMGKFWENPMENL